MKSVVSFFAVMISSMTLAPSRRESLADGSKMDGVPSRCGRPGQRWLQRRGWPESLSKHPVVRTFSYENHVLRLKSAGEDYAIPADGKDHPAGTAGRMIAVSKAGEKMLQTSTYRVSSDGRKLTEIREYDLGTGPVRAVYEYNRQ